MANHYGHLTLHDTIIPPNSHRASVRGPGSNGMYGHRAGLMEPTTVLDPFLAGASQGGSSARCPKQKHRAVDTEDPPGFMEPTTVARTSVGVLAARCAAAVGPVLGHTYQLGEPRLVRHRSGFSGVRVGRSILPSTSDHGPCA